MSVDGQKYPSSKMPWLVLVALRKRAVLVLPSTMSVYNDSQVRAKGISITMKVHHLHTNTAPSTMQGCRIKVDKTAKPEKALHAFPRQVPSLTLH